MTLSRMGKIDMEHISLKNPICNLSLIETSFDVNPFVETLLLQHCAHAMQILDHM